MNMVMWKYICNICVRSRGLPR